MDLIAELARRRWVVVGACVLVVVLVVGPALVPGRDAGRVEATGPATSTTAVTATSGPATTGPATTGPATTSTTVTSTTASSTTVTPTTGPTTTGPTTTAAIPEVDRPGDDPNPGARNPGRPDIRPRDRERAVGLDAEPARLSGWSVWVADVVPAPAAPDGTAGAWITVTIRLVNRDDADQAVSDRAFTLRRPDGTTVRPSFATPVLVAATPVPGDGEAWAELWFPAPPAGTSWLAFRPDTASDRGIWALES